MDDSRLAELLVRAVESLPEAERAEALVGLVGRGLRQPTGWPVVRGGLDLARGGAGRRASFLDDLAGDPPAQGDRRGVLVRLDQTQHERLKAWCQGHDFTMATVLRGLVDRFLEAQSQPSAPPET